MKTVKKSGKLINRLAEIGYDKRNLRKLDNKSLEELARRNQEKLDAVAKEKAKREARLIKLSRERNEWQEAENYRLYRIRKPKPRIGPTPEQMEALRKQEDQRKAVAEIQKKLMEHEKEKFLFKTGQGRSHGERAAKLLLAARNLEQALRYDQGALV